MKPLDPPRDPQGAPPTAPASRRLRALDGVRGVAALVVVLYHASLIAKPFADDGTARLVWETATETPLKLGFAGTEAVQVFFVLSGLVVTLPALRDGFSWPGYAVSRLLRLYLPVWAAILLALLLVIVFPREAADVTPDAWIVNANILFPDVELALREATLIPASYDTVNVLWSLRWELLFSILLPVFVAVALLLRRWAWPAAVACVLAMVAGRVFDERPFDLEALVYLPTFFIGCLIAVRLPDLQRWAGQRRRPLLWLGATVGSALVLIAAWWTRPFVASTSDLGHALWGLAGAGAAGLIVVAIASPLAARVLEARVPRWLGDVSFSLYLVHAPILATLAFSWGDDHWMLVALVGVPLSLAAAWAFFHVVERPAHRAARAVGSRVAALFSPTSGGGRGASPAPTRA
ncbi:acyltransferase [Microbacterium sp. Marseille-Q6965]|uniref:acyltransferase family protein n=1 Tax=Microbacterium sp. Marseille-Q6965 TaxID=2965072 RepID=UPI0021B82471|nr:acyltransferase [Microbacterium sp. Marseille-Q6965]